MTLALSTLSSSGSVLTAARRQTYRNNAGMRIVRFTGPLCLLVASAFVIVAPSAKAQNAKALLLFGGKDHDTFLGCLNCVDTAATSVCNDVGKYGSDIASESIWNDIGKYGSDISQFSPWNDIAQDVPIIVDRDGKSYGYFTTNDVHHDRTRIGWLVAILDYFQKTKNLSKTRKAMCSR